MSNYDNTNRGVLFKNDRKEKDTDPNMKGSINVEGVEYWVSAWTKEGQNGKFISLSLTPKEQTQTSAQAAQVAQKAAPPQRQQAAPVVQDLDDSIPF